MNTNEQSPRNVTEDGVRVEHMVGHHEPQDIANKMALLNQNAREAINTELNVVSHDLDNVLENYEGVFGDMSLENREKISSLIGDIRYCADKEAVRNIAKEIAKIIQLD